VQIRDLGNRGTAALFKLLQQKACGSVRGRQSLRGLRGEGTLVTGDEHGTRRNGERAAMEAAVATRCRRMNLPTRSAGALPRPAWHAGAHGRDRSESGA